jgi:hypothetical protein
MSWCHGARSADCRKVPVCSTSKNCTVELPVQVLQYNQEFGVREYCSLLSTLLCRSNGGNFRREKKDPDACVKEKRIDTHDTAPTKDTSFSHEVNGKKETGRITWADVVRGEGACGPEGRENRK